MAHIDVPEGVPGILGLFAVRPEIAKPLSELADALLRAESPLTPGQRELVASYVSRLNDCEFCYKSHSVVAKELLGVTAEKMASLVDGAESKEHSPKLRALLAIAAKVRESGRAVKPADIERARREGATDIEIHDTVLIAAAFCMLNRYVDGLAAWAPADQATYEELGKGLAQKGYLASLEAQRPQEKPA